METREKDGLDTTTDDEEKEEMENEQIREILTQPRSVAVVGCSPDPSRDSHSVAALLQRLGHHIVPVHPGGGRILDRAVMSSLREVSEPIDMVDVFRRSDAVAGIVEEALEIGARILWLQLGVLDEAAALRAREAGMTVVMDRCPAIEYRRLLA